LEKVEPRRVLNPLEMGSTKDLQRLAVGDSAMSLLKLLVPRFLLSKAER
jgi:hypothetical protein